MPRLIDVEHPRVLLRIERSFKSGQDTAYIADFLRIGEPDVVLLLAGLREQRRAQEARMRRLDAAWTGEDIDKREIAARFGFPSTASALATLSRWRRRMQSCGSAAA